MTNSNAFHETHLHMLQRELIILERKKELTLTDLLEMNRLKDEITMEKYQLKKARELHLTGFDSEVLCK